MMFLLNQSQFFILGIAWFICFERFVKLEFRFVRLCLNYNFLNMNLFKKFLVSNFGI